ncbi:MAG: SRPBCC family protein [Chitinophagales bacterium]
MKALKIIGILILLLVAVVVILGLVAPKEYNVERSITVDAPSVYVWEYVSSLEAMHEWSPWKDRDTNQVVEYTGEPGTVGSKMTWAGNENVGEGSQEIISITDEERIETELIFLMPFGESKSDAYILLKNGENQTEVTWGFNGSSPFPMNAMLLFMDMDEVLGKDFDEGLNNLKEAVESSYDESAQSSLSINEIELDRRVYVLKRDTVKFDAIGDFFEEHLGAVYNAFLEKHEEDEAGMPSGLYYSWDEENMKTYMGAGIQVNSSEVKLKGYETIVLEPGNALQVDYYGAYEGLEEPHTIINDYIAANGRQYAGPAVEEYVTDPAEEPDTSKWLTRVIYYVE